MSEGFTETLHQIATDESLQTSYLFVLSKMDEADLDSFRVKWPAIPAERRREVIQELVDISEINFEVDFSPIFLLGMGDEDAEVRESAINGLWEFEDPALIAPFIHLLQTDEAPLVRAAAATGLGRFVYLAELEELAVEMVEPIKTVLLETIYQPAEDIEVRRRAIEAISYFGGSDITKIIETAYYDDNVKMQVSAVFAMGRNSDGRWRPRVVAELDNAHSEIRFEAARACGELEAGDAVPKLIQMIDEDADLQVQEMAVWALGRIGGDDARQALEICLESEVEAIVLAAEEALDELNLFAGTFDLFEFDEDDALEMDFDDFEGVNGHNGDLYRN